MTELTVVVPSYNERDNVAPLTSQLESALEGVEAEILYVDDSSDGTADVVLALASRCRVPLRVIHRDEPVGGLAGAVETGLRAARGRHVVVMDGDLQHPAALVPHLWRTAVDAGRDLVVASRYCGEGNSSGLSSSWRRLVSSGSTLLARACFPRRVGKVCTDPMTGFFCVDRHAVDLDRLRPRGFKILLEILANHDLTVAEVPFVFGRREAGESKASWRNGLDFLVQMLKLRMGRMSRFAVVGALGTVVNLVLMALLVHGALTIDYVAASVVAAEVSILHNFFWQERFVFADMRDGVHGWWSRLGQHLALNNLEMLVRLPFLVAVVEGLGANAVVAQAFTLAVAFVVRFLVVSRVVYRPRPVPQAPVVPAAMPRVGDPRPTEGAS